jgi:hypothetical protein
MRKAVRLYYDLNPQVHQHTFAISVQQKSSLTYRAVLRIRIRIDLALLDPVLDTDKNNLHLHQS